MKIKVLLVAMTIAACSESIASSFNDAMDSTFNSMSNVTNPKAYNSARRGVVSGGQIFIRNDIKRINVASATLPSISAGCGGVDIYGGAFSFINADQMIETFQAIGSNALGYGVKLALSSACDVCENVMTSLEKTAQAINKMNMDSCTAAQGIVDAGAEFGAAAISEMKSTNKEVNSGFFEDFSESVSNDTTTGKSASKTSKENDPVAYAKDITGNITWRAMIKSNLKTAYLNGDNDLLEIFQTMVGTAIITPQIGAAETADQTPTLELRAGRMITLEQLIEGGDIKVYKCDTYTEDGCLNVSKTTSKTIAGVEGFSKKMSNVLIGVTGNEGLVKALQDDGEWSTNAKTFLKVRTPFAQMCLKKIRDTSSLGEVDIAVYIGTLCSERMALDVSYSMVLDYIHTVYLAVIESKSSHKKSALEMLSKSKADYLLEYKKLAEQADTETILANMEMITLGLKSRRRVN